MLKPTNKPTATVNGRKRRERRELKFAKFKAWWRAWWPVPVGLLILANVLASAIAYSVRQYRHATTITLHDADGHAYTARHVGNRWELTPVETETTATEGNHP